MEQRKQQQQEQNAPPSKPEGQLQFRADTGTGSGPCTLDLKEQAWGVVGCLTTFSHFLRRRRPCPSSSR